MNRTKNATALITGASSGLGYELSKLFAADGYNLVIVARNQARLTQAAAELQEKYSISVKVLAKQTEFRAWVSGLHS